MNLICFPLTRWNWTNSAKLSKCLNELREQAFITSESLRIKNKLWYMMSIHEEIFGKNRLWILKNDISQRQFTIIWVSSFPSSHELMTESLPLSWCLCARHAPKRVIVKCCWTGSISTVKWSNVSTKTLIKKWYFVLRIMM